MATQLKQLQDLVAQEAHAPAPPAVVQLAESLRKKHGDCVEAILFYGSVLRDGNDEGKIVDLYLLCDSYENLHRNPVMRFLNAALPPNVYYHEEPFEDRKVRAKYAVLTLQQFERLVTAETLHPYFWARFAQPTSVLWARDAARAQRVSKALAQSVMTLLAETHPLLTQPVSAEETWVRAFSETYRTELRAEGPERAREIYLRNKGRYDAFAEVFDRETGTNGTRESVGSATPRHAAFKWFTRRVLGKALSVARLIKAAFTFTDGASYLAWKIERHSGVSVTLTPWQKRHPILASGWLFWKLYFRGAFR